MAILITAIISGISVVFGIIIAACCCTKKDKIQFDPAPIEEENRRFIEKLVLNIVDEAADSAE